MNEALETLLSITLSALILALAIFLLKPIVKNRVSKTFMYYIWALVLLRLVVPFGFGVDIPIAVQTAPTVEEQSEALPETGDQSVTVPEENAYSKPEYSEPDHDTSDVLVGNTGMTDSPAASIPQTGNTVSIPTVDVPAELPAKEAEPDIRQTLKDNALYIWLVGAAAGIVWYIVAYAVFVLRIKRGFTAPDEKIMSEFNSLCGGRRVRIAMSKDINTPMLMGLFRPTVVLPNGEYASDQLHCILRHELVHYRRRDILYKWATVIITCLHWFNPIVYFIRREINKYCELSCDEAVIKSMDELERKTYGNTLISLASMRERRNFGMAATLCEGKKQLKGRLVNIMTFKKTTRSAICLMLLLTLLLGGCALGIADFEESKNEESVTDTSDNTSSGDTVEEEITEAELEEAYNAYRSVLLGLRKFVSTDIHEDGKTSFNIIELREYFAEARGISADNFSVIDLDQKGVPEIILRIKDYKNNFYEKYLIFHYMDGAVYAYSDDAVKLDDMKLDGTTKFGVDSSNMIVCIDEFRKQIDPETEKAFTEYRITEMIIEKGEKKNTATYKVNGEISTYEEYATLWFAQDEKSRMRWFEVNVENADLVLSVDYIPPSDAEFWGEPEKKTDNNDMFAPLTGNNVLTETYENKTEGSVTTVEKLYKQGGKILYREVSTTRINGIIRRRLSLIYNVSGGVQYREFWLFDENGELIEHTEQTYD